ncbi:hypothetical protein K458DRAFT_421302 [Lentithecium fluviatile CBS 122367]|uniref:Uncharacterized protein n=1 Tax=Lentithecium fluviatile CBS 122367 TaxID=1168545 RepID=A0A6G1IRL2_9PLEO|nr:hypothetical protein K458DRAFT_421302 [Lentithecium fluviatile CBS 122367]
MGFGSESWYRELGAKIGYVAAREGYEEGESQEEDGLKNVHMRLPCRWRFVLRAGISECANRCFAIGCGAFGIYFALGCGPMKR